VRTKPVFGYVAAGVCYLLIIIFLMSGDA
jgi:hypothetical protein